MGWNVFGMDLKEGRIRESDKDGVSPNVRRSHQGLNCWAVGHRGRLGKVDVCKLTEGCRLQGEWRMKQLL